MPYLNRGDQYRMLGYCALLLMVMFAMQAAAQPETWNWMFGGAGAGPREPTIADLELTPLEVNDSPLRDDAFEIPESNTIGDQEEEHQQAVAQADAQEAADGAAVDEEQAAVPQTTPADGPLTSDDADDSNTADVSLAPELISTIQDGSLGLFRVEEDVYLTALANVRQLPAEAFREASIGSVRFPVIMSDTRPYLGKVITIQGRLEMLQHWHVPANEIGIDKLYEGWMFTPDSGNNPWRLVLAELPTGVEIGAEQDIAIEVTGYFFKRFGYPAVGSNHLAPMLIVAELKVLPPPSKTQEQEMARDMTMLAVWFIGIVAGGTGLLVLYFRMSDRRYAGSRAAMLAAQRDAASQAELEGLKSAKVLNPDRPFDEAR